MVATNIAKSGLALLIASNGPNIFVLGSGSGTGGIDSTWVYGDLDEQAIPAVTSGTLYKIGYQGDWNSVTMSGLRLSNFGLSIGSTTSGDLWGIEAFDGNAITFDGSSELQLQVNWEVY